MSQVVKRRNRRGAPHVARACANCKERKIKCDGNLKGCATCAHRCIECTPPSAPDRRTIASRAEADGLIEQLRGELATRKITIALLEGEKARLREERDAWHGGCFDPTLAVSTDGLYLPLDPGLPCALQYDKHTVDAVAAPPLYPPEAVSTSGGSSLHSWSVHLHDEARYRDPHGRQGH
ncbi:hypothetical protein AURDEDRAFT_128261 [Auricularia subglabra TFB-10046 SS5]|nr:hypothetical protein AURDEDRAFT_128261 [Auricularia subglabra TFB-10046 SS5]